MWDKIKQYAPWVGGAAIVGYFLLGKSSGGENTSASDTALPAGVLPMFMSGGFAGGGMTGAFSGAPNLPLGGEIWQEPVVPLSENPDVKIAEIYAQVMMAGLDAQERAIGTGLPETETDGLSSRETVRYNPYGTSNAVTQQRRDVQAVKSLLSGGGNDAAYLTIYNEATARGASSDQVASTLRSAGINVGVADVNKYIAEAGLKPLNTIKRSKYMLNK